MAWLAVDDGFPEHPKLAELEHSPRLWADCLALWLAAGCYCRRALSDGEIPTKRLYRLTPLTRRRVAFCAKTPVKIGLWVQNGGGVFAFHDWQDYQPTRAKVNEQRALKSERQRRWREGKRQLAEAEAAAVDASTPGSVDAPVDAPVDASLARARSQPSPAQPSPEKREKRAKGTKRKGRETTIPDDWKPDPKVYPWARSEDSVRFDREQVDRLADKFRDLSLEKGWVAVLWDAKFRNFLRNERRYYPHLAEPGPDVGDRPRKPPGPKRGVLEVMLEQAKAAEGGGDE
jgi:hypothetical protein